MKINDYSTIATVIIIVGIAALVIPRLSAALVILLTCVAVAMIMFMANSDGYLAISGFYDGTAYRPIYFESSPGKLYTMITSMYVHVGGWHIAMNGAALYFLGMPFEEKIGKPKFLAVYFTSGLTASLLHTALFWGDTVGLVGASGAIFGILGAFAMMYPNQLFYMFGIRIKIVHLAIGYIAIELLLILANIPFDNIAHEAHIGGLIGGLAVGAILMSGKSKTRPYPGLAEVAAKNNMSDRYQSILHEEQPDVQRAWAEYIIDKSNCPRCGKKMDRIGNNAGCSCGFRARLPPRAR